MYSYISMRSNGVPAKCQFPANASWRAHCIASRLRGSTIRKSQSWTPRGPRHYGTNSVPSEGRSASHFIALSLAPTQTLHTTSSSLPLIGLDTIQGAKPAFFQLPHTSTNAQSTKPSCRDELRCCGAHNGNTVHCKAIGTPLLGCGNAHHVAARAAFHNMT